MSKKKLPKAEDAIEDLIESGLAEVCYLANGARALRLTPEGLRRVELFRLKDPEFYNRIMKFRRTVTLQ